MFHIVLTEAGTDINVQNSPEQALLAVWEEKDVNVSHRGVR